MITYLAGVIHFRRSSKITPFSGSSYLYSSSTLMYEKEDLKI